MDPNSLLNPTFSTPTASTSSTAPTYAAGEASMSDLIIKNAQTQVLNGTMDPAELSKLYDYYSVPYPERIYLNTNTSDDNNINTNITGGGSGVVYPDLSGAIAILEKNIAGLDPIYQAQVKKAIENYNIAENERKSAYAKAEGENKSGVLSNDQDVLMSRNAINKNARVASENILSILGALGMTGSTTKNALSSVADTSNTNLNEANYGYGKNKQSLLQSWNDYVNQDTNQQKQLADTKAYDIAQAGIERETSRKDLLGQIASNKINMGQFDTSDITNKIAAANTKIGELSNVPRTYTGETPKYTAPAISTLLGQNMARFDVKLDKAKGRATPKLVKVNEQTGTGDKYGLI